MKKFLHVVILKLDGVPDRNGDFFNPFTVISCDRADVPLTDHAGNMIGIVKPSFLLGTGASNLLIDIRFFDEPTPAMLELIPCYYGKCLSRFAGHILETKFTSVALHSENCDPRIPKLKTYAPSVMTVTKNIECSCERLLNGHELHCVWSKIGKN